MAPIFKVTQFVLQTLALGHPVGFSIIYLVSH